MFKSNNTFSETRLSTVEPGSDILKIVLVL